MAQKEEFPVPRVLLISPQAPPYGGMQLQAALIQRLMSEDGLAVSFLPSNLPFPGGLRFLERLRGARPFLRSVVFNFKLWKLLGRVDVVHILACSWLYFFTVVSPAVLLSRLRHKRVILNYRGGQAGDFFRWNAFWVRPFFRMADVVTAPSQFLVDVIESKIRVRVRIVPNVIDLSLFRNRQRVPVRPRMVVTRHLEKLYDVESVIRAFRDVQKDFPDASLWIAGTGEEEGHLRTIVAEWNLPNVHFLGYVPHHELAAIYDQCDILLNASRADNFPGSLVEAAAAGLVIISTAVGGIPYIFENEKTALLAPVGDWAGLADRVRRALLDPSLAARLVDAAHASCRRYDWQNVAPQLYSVYGLAPEGREDHECGQQTPMRPERGSSPVTLPTDLRRKPKCTVG